MADGLVIKHPTTGAVIFSTATITGHSRAAFNTTGSAGSQSVAGLLRGTPFVIQALPSTDTAGYNVPDFTVNGSTVSWNGAARNMRVLVGSYAVGGPGASQSFDGFLVRRPAGAVQISVADFALQLSNYGALVLTDDNGSQPLPMVRASITVSGVNPVLAFRGQDGAAINVWRVAASGGTYTFHLACQSGSPKGLVWWVFDVAGVALKLDTDVALVLADPVEVRTFDSRSYCLNFVTESEVTGIVGGEPITDILIPSGRSYAVIQSTASFTSSLQEDFEVDPGGLGQDEKWMVLNSTYAAARFNGSTLEVGLSQYEFFAGAYSKNTPATFSIYGKARHTVIDVTGLPSAAMPTPSDLAVSVNATTREVSVASNSAVTTVSPAVTATVSGGTAPYGLEWRFVDGSAAVVPNGATDGLSFQTKVINQSPGTTLSARYQLRANDASRVGFSQVVTFTHAVPTLDLTPDAISNIAAVSGSTNDPDFYFGYDYRRITGVSGPIILRFERYDYAGDADIADVVVALSADASAWYNQTPFSAKGSGLAYLDVEVPEGTYVGWKIRVATSSGRKTAAMRMVIWNLSDAAGPTQINITPLSTMVVDADDNFNIDVTPDAFSLPSQSAVTNEPDGYTGGAYFTINGINRPITLRFTRDSLVENGLLPTRRTVIGKSTNGGASYTETFLGAAAGAVVDLSASPGDMFFIKGYLVTSSGRGTASWRNIVTNLTAGQQLATTTVNLTVDDDNNYNVADTTPDAIAPSNQSLSVAGSSAYTAGTTFAVSGINTAITLRFANSLTSSSGSVSTRQMVVGRTTSGGAYSEWFIAVPNGTVDVVVNNGDQIVVKGYLVTSSGIASSVWAWTVRNQTAGGLQLASATVSQTVDNDNNYNVADIVPNAISPGNQTQNFAGSEGFTAGSYFTISGINAPIQLRFSTSGRSVTGQVTSTQMVVGRTTSGATEQFVNVGSSTTTLTANNGDQFFVKGYINTIGAGSAQWSWSVFNVTAGQSLGSASVYQVASG